MPTPQKVLAICVNWNGGTALSETVSSLLAGDYPALDVLIVDNGSTDGSLGGLPEEVEILKSETNLGFGGAINLGLSGHLGERAREYQYFLILNNDVLAEESSVSILVECACQTRALAVGPKVVQRGRPDLLEAAWGHVSWSHVLADFRGVNGKADSPRWNRRRRVQLLLGCFLLIHRELFERVGAFDERFFMYHEEVDLLYRASQEKLPVFYCPESRVHHIGGFSTRKAPLMKVFWLRKNTLLFFRKHNPSVLAWLFFSSTLLASLFLNFISLRWRRMMTITAGVRAGLGRDGAQCR